uniref:Uncharacterized protein n=1 Tax=Molossus molossus TaxID=27622 RepID=A0A7J8I9A1_MOLMO|nr:hypothetical protein HJG59_010509 [Molossus molossus]
MQPRSEAQGVRASTYGFGEDTIQPVPRFPCFVLSFWSLVSPRSRPSLHVVSQRLPLRPPEPPVASTAPGLIRDFRLTSEATPAPALACPASCLFSPADLPSVPQHTHVSSPQRGRRCQVTEEGKEKHL